MKDKEKGHNGEKPAHHEKPGASGHHTEKAPKESGKASHDGDHHASQAGESGHAGESHEARDKDALKKADVPDERFLRLLADFDNYRKRSVREKDEVRGRANEDIMKDLIVVMDHLEMALESAAQTGPDRGFMDGVRMVAQQLLSVLAKHGLTPVDAEGKAFDPAEHDALSYLPSDTVAENMVSKQTRRGYSMGGRMLRAAQVIVSRGQSAAANAGPAGQAANPLDAGADRHRLRSALARSGLAERDRR